MTIGDEAVETVITSPIQGFILEKMVEIGDPVVPLTTFQEGTALMTMAKMDELLFRGTVDEIDVGRLAEGMPVEITIGALPDARIEGRLTKISLKGRDEENATLFPVEIAVLPLDGAALRAGYSANAHVIIERRSDVLVIPERLVRFEDERTLVTVRRGPEETEEREIRTGLSDGITVEVLDGLAEGERVLEPLEAQVYEVLGAKYRFNAGDEDALAVWDTAEWERMFGFLFLGFKIFFAIVGSFTLSVGGIGVANIMYIVVRERTNEIGIKRSLGATRRSILWQFLTESMLIVVAGAALGVVVSLGVVKLMSLVPMQEFVGTPTISLQVAAVTMALLAFIAVLAGLFPARRAATLEPVECLRD